MHISPEHEPKMDVTSLSSMTSESIKKEQFLVPAQTA